jgi:hypothetical protein
MMGTKHKHYDVIVAWAAGEEIEFFDGGFWYPLSTVPDWSSSQYRIKPKRVKKEGWVNVFDGPWFVVHTSKDRADMDNNAIRKKLACIRIEWEEDA